MGFGVGERLRLLKHFNCLLGVNARMVVVVDVGVGVVVWGDRQTEFKAWRGQNKVESIASKDHRPLNMVLLAIVVAEFFFFYLLLWR